MVKHSDQWTRGTYIGSIVYDRVGERDALRRWLRRVFYRGHKQRLLFQKRMARKERTHVAIWAHAQQNQIKARELRTAAALVVMRQKKRRRRLKTHIATPHNSQLLGIVLGHGMWGQRGIDGEDLTLWNRNLHTKPISRAFSNADITISRERRDQLALTASKSAALHAL